MGEKIFQRLRTIHLKQSKWYIAPKALTNWPLITWPHEIHILELFSLSVAFDFVTALLPVPLVFVLLVFAILVLILLAVTCFILFISL